MFKCHTRLYLIFYKNKILKILDVVKESIFKKVSVESSEIFRAVIFPNTSEIPPSKMCSPSEGKSLEYITETFVKGSQRRWRLNIQVNRLLVSMIVLSFVIRRMVNNCLMTLYDLVPENVKNELKKRFINLFQAKASFLYPLKGSGHFLFSNVFRCYTKRALA